MKKFLVVITLLSIVGSCFAQRTVRTPRNKIQEASAVTDEAAIRPDQPRRTGISRKYTYAIEKIILPSEQATDVKLSFMTNSTSHKITITVDHNDGGMDWKLSDAEGTALDENWWTGKQSVIGFGRYGAGTYYLLVTDALGKQARYRIKKILN